MGHRGFGRMGSEAACAAQDDASVPDPLGVDGFDAPEDVGLNRAHFADEVVGLLFCVEQDLVGDLACAHLLAFPEGVGHGGPFLSAA